MAETLVHTANVQSGQLDEFSVLVRLRPDGLAEILTSAGMLKPVLVSQQGPTTVRLRMPIAQHNQVLRLEVTQEVP